MKKNVLILIGAILLALLFVLARPKRKTLADVKMKKYKKPVQPEVNLPDSEFLELSPGQVETFEI